MKKKLVLYFLCLLLVLPHAVAEESMNTDALLPVVVVLYGESSENMPTDLLLIVIHKKTGKAMKVTLSAHLFLDETFDLENTESRQTLLKSMEKKLGISLEKYVCVGTDVLRSLEPGKAKEMGTFELIGLGLSLIGSTQTNLSIGEAVQAFQLAFSEKDGAIEILLPDAEYVGVEALDADEWIQIRALLHDAIKELEADP